MSYCRFSTDDFQCDMYVYFDVVNRWTTHVAAMRVVYKKELPPPIPLLPETKDRWLERYHYVGAMREEAERVPIGLPCDGQTFYDDSPGACADRVEALRDMGYRVPQSVIDALRAEQEEMEAR